MKVRVRNPIYAKRHVYASYMHIPEFYDREGDQVPAPKWAEPGTICLTTGDPSFPVRTIHPSMIVSIDDAPMVRTESRPESRIVEVQGSKGSVYSVTITAHSRSCNCPGYAYRRSCRHIGMAA